MSLPDEHALEIRTLYIFIASLPKLTIFVDPKAYIRAWFFNRYLPACKISSSVVVIWDYVAPFNTSLCWYFVLHSIFLFCRLCKSITIDTITSPGNGRFGGHKRPLTNGNVSWRWRFVLIIRTYKCSQLSYYWRLEANGITKEFEIIIN